VLVVLGDLVEDVVVELNGPVNIASDTDVRIRRRPGGSAANVAAAAARLGAPTRFVGQVGDDPLGGSLTAELAATGVDVDHVRRAGRTATIVVLVDASGERTMLVDRGSARELDGVDASWLDGATVLHLTLYSLLDEPIATTGRTLAELARRRAVPVSVDVSSTALIEAAGPDRVLTLIRSLRPSVVFANADEAELLALDGPLDRALVVVKRGAEPCLVHTPGAPPVAVAALAVGGVVDTTGAGDAFAAGMLTHPGWRDDPEGACRAGHRSAHALLESRERATRRDGAGQPPMRSL
jgi:sugar/nucleoside kinase (ribokinase family)